MNIVMCHGVNMLTSSENHDVTIGAKCQGHKSAKRMPSKCYTFKTNPYHFLVLPHHTRSMGSRGLHCRTQGPWLNNHLICMLFNTCSLAVMTGILGTKSAWAIPLGGWRFSSKSQCFVMVISSRQGM